MKRNKKRLIFWALMMLMNLCIIESVLSLFFFQTTSQDPLAIVHYWRIAKQSLQKVEQKPVGIWERDDRFGYSHISNATGIHKNLDYQATYTIGENGERFIPPSENPTGRILLLGGSFTFGHGVDDDKNYPYILAKEHWTKWRIVNKAVMGWGTSHAYMALSEELESDAPPFMVIYGMIPHHITRNYIRRSWVSVIAKYDRDHPHFELVDGHPVFQGVVNVATSAIDGPEMRKKELELTASFLAAMRNKCEQKQIPFIVILLPHIHVGWPPAIIKNLVEFNIPFLDLSEMRLERFPNDIHPNPNDHRLIAESISHSFIAEKLDRLSPTR